MPRTRVALAAGGLLATVLVQGCSGLEFAQDRRLTFTSPTANEVSSRPVQISWSMTDFAASPGGDRYVVFLDQAPIKVGQTLRSLVPSRIPDEAVDPLLNSTFVYPTADTSITLTNVPDVKGEPVHAGQRQRHTVTVVLVDSSGLRTTESAWTRSFDLKALGNGGVS